MGVVTCPGGGVTLQSSFRVLEKADGSKSISRPTMGGGKIVFTVAGLPEGAKVTRATVNVTAEKTGPGTFTLGGSARTAMVLPALAGAARNGMPVTVSVGFQAKPTGEEDGSAVVGRFYVRSCTVTAAVLVLEYESGGSGGGDGSGGGSDAPGQSGNVIALKGPGRAGRGCHYFPEGTRDFSGNGLALRPVSALIEGEKNGAFSAKLELLMDDSGVWKRIGRRGIIRMPAPARQVLGAVEKTTGEESFSAVVPSAGRGYIYLYSKPSSMGGDSWNLGRVPNGEKMVLLEEVNGSQGGTWYRVSWEKRGLTGYCDGSQVTVETGEQVSDKTVLRMQERDQLFRVDGVEIDEDAGTVRIEARHIFYDLQKAVLIGSECEMQDVTVEEALQRLQTGADHPLPFGFFTDCESRVTGDFRGQNVVEALMDPDGGILAQAGASLMRDNFDVYVLQTLGEDRGVRIQHGRNCAGARVNFSTLPTANRIVAVMDKQTTVHDDPNRGADEEILAVVRKYKKEDGTAEEQARKEFENGLAGVEFEMEVDFQLLAETSRYPQYAGMQQLFLGDSMHITLRQGKYAAQMSGYKYNAILRKYDEVTVGATDVDKSRGSVASYQVGGVSTGKLLGSVQGSQLAAESITTDKLAAASVTAEKLAAGALTADNIAAGSITADKLAANAVTANKILAGAVTTDKISANAVTTKKLAAGAVTADKIAGKTITADKMQAGLITADSGLIGDSAIGTAQIADGSITDAKIVGLTASKITAGTLDAADVNVINLKADNITTGTLNGKVIPQLGEDKIADGAVSGVKIVNGAVTTDKIDDGAVTAAKIVSSAVTTDKLAANAVTANKILAGAVTTDKLSANAVTTDKLAAQSVTANKLASGVGSSLDLSSNNSVKLMVDEVQVGGANLFPDTRLMDTCWYDQNGAGRPVTRTTDNEGFTVVHFPAVESSSNVWTGVRLRAEHNIPYSQVRNKKVTLSFDWRSVDWPEGTRETYAISFYTRKGDGSNGRSVGKYFSTDASPQWSRKKLTYTITDDFFTSNLGDTIDENTKFYITLWAYQASAFEIRKIKLELGNKATDWSPAPSDGAYSSSAVLDRTGIHLNTGGTFTVDSQNFDVDGDGKMTAKAGSIGGWEIAPGSLKSGSGTKHVRLSTEDATYAIWAGAETGGSAPFRVTRDGKVYLTKLYVTDENGNAQANPVNLSGSWWRTNRAVQTLETSGNTLTITLYDGTTVNFKKADGYGYITGLANGNTITIGGYKLNESGQGEIVDSGAITLTLDTENKKVNFSGGAGFKNFTAANGMDVTEMYNTGWNKCIDNCSYQSDVYTISETQPASPLYMKVGDNYTSVGTGWVRTVRATGMYRIPGKKT